MNIFIVYDVVRCFREIDLLKEENVQLKKTIYEKSAKLAAVEEELKKTRETKVDSEVQHLCVLSVVSSTVS